MHARALLDHRLGKLLKFVASSHKRCVKEMEAAQKDTGAEVANDGGQNEMTCQKTLGRGILKGQKKYSPRAE